MNESFCSSNTFEAQLKCFLLDYIPLIAIVYPDISSSLVVLPGLFLDLFLGMVFTPPTGIDNKREATSFPQIVHVVNEGVWNLIPPASTPTHELIPCEVSETSHSDSSTYQMP